MHNEGVNYRVLFLGGLLALNRLDERRILRVLNVSPFDFTNYYILIFLFYLKPNFKNDGKSNELFQLVLNSMHKYQPRIHLVKRSDGGNCDPIEDLDREPHKTFVFPEAIFTAVTAYQNQLVSFIYFIFLFVNFTSTVVGFKYQTFFRLCIIELQTKTLSKTINRSEGI